MSTIVTRAGKGSALTWVEADANFTNLNTDKAELASPTFTGTPAAPTAAVGTNTTQVATTAFVQGKTAAQTPFTATGNIVATNVQSAIVEVDTEKVAKAGDTMTGPLRTPSSQVGTSATTTENHFWDGSVANQLTLKRGTPEAPGVELIKALNGVLSFPNQGQSLSADGYVKLPGGVIIQWGYNNTGVTAARTISFPIAFPDNPRQIIAIPDGSGDMSAQLRSVSVELINNTSFSAKINYVNNGGVVGYSNAAIRWIAIGN